MYIKQVTLEGFKSYGRRVEVGPFDSEFTAITGLNGTGKSNILDSIVFVLGITSLEKVRAQKLPDLVYQRGQAGITKATVTITFDNTDPNNRPLLYQNCSQITVMRTVVVGGKNKYMINGRNVQNKQVQDLFCSVQLNVNNPNFLIMQGQVTKVMNMKPADILKMIEEAAGTSQYEEKRKSSMDLMAKKQLKLDELDLLIKENIYPKLEKLRKDKERYEEYQKICRDFEYLTRIYISYKYLQCEKAVENCESEKNRLKAEITQNQETIKAHEAEIVEIDEKVTDLQQIMDTQSGGELTELEKQMEELNKKDSSLKAKISNAKDNIVSDERKLKTLSKNIQIDENALKKKEGEMEKMGGMFESLKLAAEADKQEFIEAQKRFEAVSSGLSLNDEGQATSLQDQLATAKSKASEASSKIKESEMELKHSASSLNSKQKENKSNDTAYLKDKEIIEKTQRELQSVEAQLGKISYEDGEYENMQDRSHTLQQEFNKMRQEVTTMGGDRWEFKYADPAPNFDHSRVKGMVANLFKIKDPKYSQALSVLGGGHLRSVIVDSEQTGKLLLQRGNLQTRTTMIPLNKISARSINPRTSKFAQDLVGKDNVSPALDLIEYHPDLENAMRFIFGSSFVCTNMDVAKKVTYHNSIHTRSVTLEGDVMDPEGTLSGGSRPQGNPILDDIRRINDIKKAMAGRSQELKEIYSQMQQIKDVAEQYRKLKEKFEMLQLQLKTVQTRIHTTTFQQAQDEIDELKEKIETLKKTIEESREVQKQNQAKAKEIESRLKDSKGHRDRELKASEDTMKKAKQKSEQSKNNWKKRENEYETLKLEIEELKKTIDQSKEQLATMEANLEAARINFAELNAGNEESRIQVDALKQKIKEQKDKISSQNKEIKLKIHRKEKLLKNNQDIVLDIKKKENEITKIENENKDGYNKINALTSKYPWIEEDKAYFGHKNTRYDYSKEDPQEAGKKLNKMQEEKEKLSRNINQQAMMLLEKEEDHYKRLTERFTKVQEDKKKLQNIIRDLDEKKRQNIKQTWTEVNKNFGAIFSSLLPRTQAELIPEEGKSFMDGLKFRIGFNGKWKESLAELSGGQKSLVALSLILAQLKYKPAPFYILDEVDAALDLSHTQNIGSMLKTHFKGSQFIVVSLKDGMFNNANVLFRTKFVDGISGVDRKSNKPNEK